MKINKVFPMSYRMEISTKKFYLNKISKKEKKVIP